MIAELTSKDVLGEGGLLQKANPDFAPREMQLAMSDAIEAAIHERENLLVEAGTGTGKTFAYLVPAILSGKKVVISTGTKNLQDQLFFKDLPFMIDVIGKPVKTALLKGRSNYLCHYRLNYYAQEQTYGSKKLIAELNDISEWSQVTKRGDIAELTHISEDSMVWPNVTSTNDNCLSGECEFIDKCCVMDARKKALGANVVVINHHLFFADLLLKEQGVGELLPDADIVIFDEAHQLVDTATQFYSERVSSRQVIQLVHDASAELLASKTQHSQLLTTLEKLESTVRKMREAFGPKVVRELWSKLNNPGVKKHCATVLEHLEQIAIYLEALSNKSSGIALCHERCLSLKLQFTRLTQQADENDFVHWYELYAQSFVIYLTPKSVASQFGDIAKSARGAWIFTSATLTSNHEFDYFANQLGLQSAKQLRLDSPFDFKQQALLYMPRDIPDTHDKDYIDAIIAAVLPVLEASQGRAFLLFTSYYALRKAESLLLDVDFELFVQGSKSKRVLLEGFVNAKRAVLLGTASFWEGVDIPGDDLTCVVIDKLPFAPPEDPVVRARIEAQRDIGQDPFYSFQLPCSAISLKQGVGRLIRGVNDKGVLVICDPRLYSREYGRVLFNSLPGMTITREISKVTEFLGEI